MRGNGVAFVLGHFVPRPLKIKLAHQPIPAFLGHDRCRRNGRAMPVAANQRFKFHIAAPARRHFRQVGTIDPHPRRPAGQAEQRAAHGQQAGAQHIQPINFLYRRQAHGPGQATAADRLLQPSALRGRKRFGVANPGNPPAFGKSHGRGHHRAGKRAPAGLIHAGENSGAGREGVRSSTKAGRLRSQVFDGSFLHESVSARQRKDGLRGTLIDAPAQRFGKPDEFGAHGLAGAGIVVETQ